MKEKKKTPHLKLQPSFVDRIIFKDPARRCGSAKKGKMRNASAFFSFFFFFLLIFVSSSAGAISPFLCPGVEFTRGKIDALNVSLTFHTHTHTHARARTMSISLQSRAHNH